MKPILKKILKILLAFIISTSIIYLIFTIKDFYNWCDRNSLLSIFNPFHSATDDLRMIDSDKIKEIGNNVGTFEAGMKQSLEESPYANDGIDHYIGDGHNHTKIAELFDPTGFAVWAYIYNELRDIFVGNISLSIILGIAITIAYIAITAKNINSIVKVIIGYLIPIIIVPQLYMYSYTYRFWDVYTTYFKASPKYFYIIYTIIFILFYIINYIITLKRTERLNKAIKNN